MIKYYNVFLALCKRFHTLSALRGSSVVKGGGGWEFVKIRGKPTIYLSVEELLGK